ncbi:MAG TPA: alpha/beta hydrolase, partial [Rectinemataceae bacterium]|nr:alpha/beta hydrolase [Rectinemataceae bacterium]
MKHILLRGSISLGYEEEGSGIPLLLIHGNTGSHIWYERVMRIGGCRTIAPDMPNFGASSQLEGPPDIGRYADALHDFVSALELGRPVILGHSLGGAVAMALALRPDMSPRGLILVDSAPPSGLVTPVSRHPFIERMSSERDTLSTALKAVVPTLEDAALFERLVDEAL